MLHNCGRVGTARRRATYDEVALGTACAYEARTETIAAHFPGSVPIPWQELLAIRSLLEAAAGAVAGIVYKLSVVHAETYHTNTRSATNDVFLFMLTIADEVVYVLPSLMEVVLVDVGLHPSPRLVRADPPPVPINLLRPDARENIMARMRRFEAASTALKKDVFKSLLSRPGVTLQLPSDAAGASLSRQEIEKYVRTCLDFVHCLDGIPEINLKLAVIEYVDNDSMNGPARSFRVRGSPTHTKVLASMPTKADNRWIGPAARAALLVAQDGELDLREHSFASGEQVNVVREGVKVWQQRNDEMAMTFGICVSTLLASLAGTFEVDADIDGGGDRDELEIGCSHVRHSRGAGHFPPEAASFSAQSSNMQQQLFADYPNVVLASPTSAPGETLRQFCLGGSVCSFASEVTLQTLLANAALAASATAAADYAALHRLETGPMTHQAQIEVAEGAAAQAIFLEVYSSFHNSLVSVAGLITSYIVDHRACIYVECNGGMGATQDVVPAAYLQTITSTLTLAQSVGVVYTFFIRDNFCNRIAC